MKINLLLAHCFLSSSFIFRPASFNGWQEILHSTSEIPEKVSFSVTLLCPYCIFVLLLVFFPSFLAICVFLLFTYPTLRLTVFSPKWSEPAKSPCAPKWFHMSVQQTGQATKADFLSVMPSYSFNKKNSYAVPYNHVTFFDFSLLT